MKFLDENAELELPCPTCGHKFKKKIGRIKGEFQCPKCGAGLKADQFASALKQVEKATADFAREIRKLGGK